MFYLQARVEQSHIFIIVHLPVLTTMPDHSHVAPHHAAVRELMYPSWVPRNTHLTCVPGTNKTNPFPSCQELQVPVQAWTPSPLYARPGLRTVQGPPSIPASTQPVRKVPEPMTREKQAFLRPYTSMR
jgi:hypothetical protein